VLLAFVGPALAANPSDWDDCKAWMSDPDRGLSGCTEIINGGTGNKQYRSMIYSIRASAYFKKGDTDRAIADENDAIRLDPKRATLYSNRGSAYLTKGDVDLAIADYSEAIRLGPKMAKTYSNRAGAYNKKGDSDRAIADANEAIRLDPKLVNAYAGRAIAYDKKGDIDRAIADDSEAIRLDPESAMAYANRAFIYLKNGSNDLALADYNQVISIDPKNSDSYLRRGRLNLYAGSLDKALADLNQANVLAPKYAYAALWLDIVSQRNKLPSRLAQTSLQLDMTAWPAPIVRLFMGQTTPSALLAAAESPDAATKKGQVCEANFYSGELSLMKGSKAEAIDSLRLAASDCPHSFAEWYSANSELRLLGATP
jgi:tetratricopeptide (TPR) repeat protein